MRLNVSFFNRSSTKTSREICEYQKKPKITGDDDIYLLDNARGKSPNQRKLTKIPWDKR